MHSLHLIPHSTGSLLPPVGYGQPLLPFGLAAYSRRSRPRHYGRLSSGAQARVGRGTVPARAAILRSSAMVRRSRGRLALLPSLLKLARSASACGPLFRVEVPETKSGAVTIAPRPVSSLSDLTGSLSQQLYRLAFRVRMNLLAKDRADAADCRAQVLGNFADSLALEIQDVCRYGVHEVQGLSVDLYRVQPYVRNRISIIRTDCSVRVLWHEGLLSCLKEARGVCAHLRRASVIRLFSEGAGASFRTVCPELDVQQGSHPSSCTAVFSEGKSALETTVGRPFYEGAVTSFSLTKSFFVFWVGKTPWRDAMVQTIFEIFPRTFRYCPLVSV